MNEKKWNLNDIGFYVWGCIVILVGLNLLGVGEEYPITFQITWFLLACIGFEISRGRGGKGE